MPNPQSTTETTEIWVDRKGMEPFKITVPVGEPERIVAEALAQRPLSAPRPDRPLKEWEVYTLDQSWPSDDVESAVNCDRMLAAKLNDGWEIVNFWTIRDYGGSVERVVTMKRRTPCPKCGELRGADAFCSNRDCSDYLGW